MLDMHSRLKHGNGYHVMNATVLAVLALWAGPWWLVTLFGASGFMVADQRCARSKRPEYILGVAWLIAFAALIAAVALTRHDRPVLVVMFFPLLTGACAIFPIRGALVGFGVTVAAASGLMLELDRASLAAHPLLLAAPLGAMVLTAYFVIVIIRAETEHRSAAVIDQLTGTLNRNALATRVAELEHQSKLTGGSVALILGDVDHFKSVNDRYGHATGDVVLKEVADRLREQLRGFDSIYRIGGEEFMIVLPGSDEREAAPFAKRLCDAVRAVPLGGIAVTMSFGVAASGEGCPFVYEAQFARADARMYEAKHAGRDPVHTKSEDTLVAGRPSR